MCLDFMPVWAKLIYGVSLLLLMIYVIIEIIKSIMIRDEPYEREFRQEQNRLNYELELELRKQKDLPPNTTLPKG